jgi:hypothetical protein
MLQSVVHGSRGSNAFTSAPAFAAPTHWLRYGSRDFK